MNTYLSVLISNFNGARVWHCFQAVNTTAKSRRSRRRLFFAIEPWHTMNSICVCYVWYSRITDRVSDNEIRHVENKMHSRSPLCIHSREYSFCHYILTCMYIDAFLILVTWSIIWWTMQSMIIWPITKSLFFPIS